MLLSYKFENFLSFKDKVEFTMLAPGSKVKNRFPDNYVKLKSDYDVLKNAVIVGENAGGKSNFVQSFYYFKDWFITNGTVHSYKNTINENNYTNKCPLKNETKQLFEIEISGNNDVIFHYLVEVDIGCIVSERLDYKETRYSEYKNVFHVERNSGDLLCDTDPDNCNAEKCEHETKVGFKVTTNHVDSKISRLVTQSMNLKNLYGLFVSKFALLGEERSIDFINIIQTTICPVSSSKDFTTELDDPKNKDEYLKILNTKEYFEIFRLVDYSINRIEIDENNPFKDTMIYRNSKSGKEFARKIGSDSSGVYEFFLWAIRIYEVVYMNKIIIADEMDRVLNPVLSDRVIAFLNAKNHTGQFIFTSHNVLHLDLKNYMKEQIFFITKDSETLESELYSLADFPEVRYETTKVYEFYMKGILGGTAIE
jgi:AAA15 family ATPase/GTPase